MSEESRPTLFVSSLIYLFGSALAFTMSYFAFAVEQAAMALGGLFFGGLMLQQAVKHLRDFARAKGKPRND